MRKTIILSLLIVVVGQYLGEFFGFYSRIWEYDSLMHILGGIFAGSIGIDIAQKLKKENYYLFAITSSLIIGILWELKQRYIQRHIYPSSDTAMDLIMDVVGGILIALVFVKINKKIDPR